MATLEDAKRIIAALPEVEEGLRFRHVTWFVKGAAFAWDRPFSKADLKRFGTEVPPAGPILAVMVEDLLEKEAVLEASSGAVFTIPHFDGFPGVLIQLSAVRTAELRELVTGAWAACAPSDLVASFLGQR